MISTNRTRLTATQIRVALLFLSTSAALWAQSGAGTIQGTVKDATSAAIPSVTINALNQATGVAVDTTSNSAGFYALKGLFAGTYLKAVGDPGFLAYFDFNGDNRIDVADLGQFAVRYLTTLP